MTLALFAVALWSVDRVLGDYRLSDVGRAITAMPAWALILALTITAGSYGALVGYDFLALRILGRTRRWGEIFVPAFVSSAVSASAPGSLLTAGGVRYRLYRPLGLGAADTTAVTVLNAVTWVLGLGLLGGVVLGLLPGIAVPGIPTGYRRATGLALLVVPAAYLGLAIARPGPIRIRGFTLHMPTVRLAALQLSVSMADWLLSSAALYVLLRTIAPVGFVPVLSAFLVAQSGSLLLPVPGGLGVFEAIVLMLRPAETDAPAVLAALLAYRVIY